MHDRKVNPKNYVLLFLACVFLFAMGWYSANGEIIMAAICFVGFCTSLSCIDG